MQLTRYKNNPILEPIKEHSWESLGVFNCGVYFDGKIVHMLYRAVGEEKISRFGYAWSKDGIHFKRLARPVFALRPKPKFISETNKDFRGIEDPRITKIENKIY